MLDPDVKELWFAVLARVIQFTCLVRASPYDFEVASKRISKRSEAHSAVSHEWPNRNDAQRCDVRQRWHAKAASP
jgi:hypothetical protein